MAIDLKYIKYKSKNSSLNLKRAILDKFEKMNTKKVDWVTVSWISIYFCYNKWFWN